MGLSDDIELNDAVALVEAAAKMEKPLLVRLPFYECYDLAPRWQKPGRTPWF